MANNFSELLILRESLLLHLFAEQALNMVEYVNYKPSGEARFLGLGRGLMQIHDGDFQLNTTVIEIIFCDE